MIDLHCHILPGVDDGASCLADSLEMAAIAAANGTTVIAATPHCNIPEVLDNYWSAEVSEPLQRLQQALREQQIPLRVVSGQEVFLAGPLRALIRQGKLRTLDCSRYLLVETDVMEHFAVLQRKLRLVQAEGLIPILAHPERYACMMVHPERAEKLRAMGVLLQCNGGSLLGHFGRDAMETARYLLEHRLADFVASDGHSPYRRIPNLAEFHEWISENLSAAYADFLLEENPGRVLRHEAACHFEA